MANNPNLTPDQVTALKVALKAIEDCRRQNASTMAAVGAGSLVAAKRKGRNFFGSSEAAFVAHSIGGLLYHAELLIKDSLVADPYRAGANIH